MLSSSLTLRRPLPFDGLYRRRNKNVISRHYVQRHYRRRKKNKRFECLGAPSPRLNWDLKNEENFAFAFLFRLLLAHTARRGAAFFIQDFTRRAVRVLVARTRGSDVENGKIHPTREAQAFSLSPSPSPSASLPVSDVCLNIFPSPVFPIASFIRLCGCIRFSSFCCSSFFFLR